MRCMLSQGCLTDIVTLGNRTNSRQSGVAVKKEVAGPAAGFLAPRTLQLDNDKNDESQEPVLRYMDTPRGWISMDVLYCMLELRRGRYARDLHPELARLRSD